MGRKKKDTNIINIEELEIENKVEIDYDKLADAIVRANQKLQFETQQTESSYKAEPRRTFKEKLKSVWHFLKIPFLSEKEIKGRNYTTSLLFSILQATFFCIKIMLYVTSLRLILSIFLDTTTTWEIVGRIFKSAICFFWGRVFNFVGVEVSHEKDTNYLFSLFSLVIAVVALIVAVLPLVEEGV